LLFQPGVMVTSVPWQLESSQERAERQYLPPSRTVLPEQRLSPGMNGGGRGGRTPPPTPPPVEPVSAEEAQAPPARR
jgi:hypothetical protein